MIGRITRREAEQFLAAMDRQGVDELRVCPLCGHGVISLELCEAYRLPVCAACVQDAAARRETDERERKNWEQKARGGHFGEPNEGYEGGGAGWVYLARTDFGTVKIGATRRSVSERCRASFGKFLHAVYTDAPFGLEGMLHRYFAQMQAHGEYYELSPQQIEEVRRINTVYGRPVKHCATMAEVEVAK